MRLIIFGLVFVFAGLAFAEGATEKKQSQWLSDWEQEAEDEGINAQCRQHKNNINQCKYTTVVDDSISALSAVILDVDNYK